MRGLLLLATALGLALTFAGQTGTFDIAAFVVPQGWSRSKQTGVLMLLQQRKTFSGTASFCRIYLFPSRASRLARRRTSIASGGRESAPLSELRARPAEVG